MNAVAPVLLLDAEQREDNVQAELLVEVLQALPPNRDHIVRRFQDLGTDCDSAFAAQGLHQLYRSYCTEGRCLQCEIGRHLLDR